MPSILQYFLIVPTCRADWCYIYSNETKQRSDADFSRDTAVSGRDRQSWMLRGTVGWIQLRLSGGLLMRLQGMSLNNRAANDLQ